MEPPPLSLDGDCGEVTSAEENDLHRNADVIVAESLTGSKSPLSISPSLPDRCEHQVHSSKTSISLNMDSIIAEDSSFETGYVSIISHDRIPYGDKVSIHFLSILECHSSLHN